MLNKVFIMGRMVRDPELRRTQSGTAVCSFTVAVDRDVKNQDGSRDTDFIDCVAWKNTAEFVSKYFTKGRMIVCGGSLNLRDWTDKDGNKRRNAEVVVRDVYFGDSQRDASHDSVAPAPQTYGGASGFEEVEDDGDLPF